MYVNDISVKLLYKHSLLIFKLLLEINVQKYIDTVVQIVPEACA